MPHTKKNRQKAPATAIVPEVIARKICNIREQRVMLDADLAEIYGVSTKRLNEQVKRNRERFPADFVFQLTKQELDRSQFATGFQKHRDPRFLPYVFTEHGAIMATNVLNSRQAVIMSVYVVRAFIKLRHVSTKHKALANILAKLERKLTARLDIHEEAILKLFAEIQQLFYPPEPEPEKPKRKIGFHVN
jgi:hypothetical protein